MRTLLLLLLSTLCVSASADDDILEDLSDDTLPTQPAPVADLPKEDPYTPPPAESRSEVQTRDPRIPKYQLSRPNWGFELAFSMNSLGGQNLVSFQSETAKAVALQFDYQPDFLQSLGVIGIGPMLSIYPIFGTTVTSTQLALWSLGGQFRYQARFFRNQPIVPVAGYSIEYFRYQFQAGPSGSLILQGPVLGVWVFLNIFEPSSAAQLYIDYKISRSYFVAEMRFQSGSDGNISIGGSSQYFGLRFEY